VSPSFDWLFWLIRASLFVAMATLLFRYSLRRFQIHSIAIQRWICGVVILQGCVLGAILIPLPFLSPVQDETSIAEERRGEVGSLNRDNAAQITDEVSWFNGAPNTNQFPSSNDLVTDENAEEVEARGASFTNLSVGQWNWIAFSVWIAGMIAVVAWQLGTYCLFVLTLRTQTATPRVKAIWESLQREAGLKRTIPVYASPKRGPVLCRLGGGYCLIVPIGFEQLCDEAQVEAILKHELSHYVRGDIWKACCLQLLSLPHWFNPAVWWTLAHFRRCAEWASDEAAASTLGERIEYARALQSIAGHTRVSSSLFVYGAATHPLVGRVQRLLTSPTSEDSWMKKSILIIMALGLLTVQTVHFQLVAQEPEADIVRETKAKLKDLNAQKDQLISKLDALRDEASQLGDEVDSELDELKELVKDRSQISDDVNKRIDAIINGGDEASQLKALDGVDKLGKEGILILGAAAKKSAHRKVRQKALTTVGEIGRAAMPAVAFSYLDLDNEDRTHLVEILGPSKFEFKTHLFHKIAKNADAALMKVMLRYVDKADDKRLFLAALSREDDAAHNGFLIDYAANLEDDDAIFLLFVTASSSDELAPKALKHAVKYKEKAFPILAGCFDSDSVELRKAVVLAAQEIGGAGGKFLIQHALESENEDLRHAAKEALEK
jgi:beta-lactamase regulating signal transducer with metallopeptidase domain